VNFGFAAHWGTLGAVYFARCEMFMIRQVRRGAAQQTTRNLRSNFERGPFRWAVRRVHWKALGITDAYMEKPKIVVVNTSSELARFRHTRSIELLSCRCI
jgi:hypothetical protein